MRIRSLVVVVSMSTAAVLTTGGAASAAPATYAPPTVQSVDSVVIASSHAGGGAAIVKARYRCYGGDVGTHLFVAVKQGNVSPQQTESSNATVFYSTNWNSDGPSLSLHCDGASHSASFRLLNDPYWWNTEAAPQLQNGPALIQFCLFDSTGSEETGFVLDYSMGTVRVLN